MDAGRRELVTGRELSPIARLTGSPHSDDWQSASGDADYVYDDLGVYVSCQIWQHEVCIMRKVWVKARGTYDHEKTVAREPQAASGLLRETADRSHLYSEILPPSYRRHSTILHICTYIHGRREGIRS